MFRFSVLIFCAVILFTKNGSAYHFRDIILQTVEIVKYFLKPYNSNLPNNEVVQFYCAKYTDKIFDRVYFDDPDIETKVNISKPFAFIIHGWIDTGNETWMLQLANTWIENYDTNVCRIGWDNYAYAEYIYAATQNVKLVAGYAANFIKSLHNNYGVSYGDITIAGHSLGAHVAGDIGFVIGAQQLKRIIGLDPAGPLFTIPFKISTDHRLDKSDAQEVIIIHTTDGSLGLGTACGHQDFYPDKGLAIQPGCGLGTGFYGSYERQLEPISCSHIRAVRIFHNSLLPKNKCSAMKCENLTMYLLNKYEGALAQIGPYTNIALEGSFFLTTDGKGGCNGNY